MFDWMKGPRVAADYHAPDAPATKCAKHLNVVLENRDVQVCDDDGTNIRVVRMVKHCCARCGNTVACYISEKESNV